MQGCPMRAQGGSQEPVWLLKHGKRGRWWVAERGLVPAPAATLPVVPEPTESWYGDVEMTMGPENTVKMHSRLAGAW